MKSLVIGIIACILIVPFSHSETHTKTVAGYNFDNYKVDVYQGKKAPIKFDKASKVFRTQISNDYALAKDNFGGHYTVAMWGCGSDCISAVMVDRKTGAVFYFPVGDFYYGCSLDENEDYYDSSILFKQDSRLLITTSCQNYEDEKVAKQTKTYHIKIWNEKTKQFEKRADVEKVKFY
ncbi:MULTISPECIES: hypothetical protein [unclassified Moraxella]|uniref:hypothetical protein n=1 Tax=unclassified Moraxella TaxID=2685852 RepID=UPI003AF4819A